jgi:hypothetical protein
LKPSGGSRSRLREGPRRVAAKLDKVAKAQEGVVATSTNVEKSTGSVEQAFKRTERALDANVVAYDKYASGKGG